MATLRTIVRAAGGTSLRALVFAIFSAVKRLPTDRMIERLTQALSFIVRSIPENRTKAIFVEHSLVLKEHRFSFVFESNEAGILWTASAFPDLLTRHMIFEGMYQEDVLVALRALVKDGDTVFDVGGHHGLMALVSSVAAGTMGKVVTFEPNPHARRQLETHLTINKVHNVVVES